MKRRRRRRIQEQEKWYKKLSVPWPCWSALTTNESRIYTPPVSRQPGHECERERRAKDCAREHTNRRKQKKKRADCADVSFDGILLFPLSSFRLINQFRLLFKINLNGMFGHRNAPSRLKFGFHAWLLPLFVASHFSTMAIKICLFRPLELIWRAMERPYRTQGHRFKSLSWWFLFFLFYLFSTCLAVGCFASPPFDIPSKFEFCIFHSRKIPEKQSAEHLANIAAYISIRFNWDDSEIDRSIEMYRI